MPSVFDLSKFPPADVLENVNLFVEGKASFHELPRKQGRKHRIIRTILGTVLPGGTDRSIPLQSGRTGRVGGDIRFEPELSGSGGSAVSGKTAHDGKRPSVQRGQLLSESLSKSSKRRTRSSVSESAVESPKVLPVAEAKAPEVTVKRKSGRPRRNT